MSVNPDENPMRHDVVIDWDYRRPDGPPCPVVRVEVPWWARDVEILEDEDLA